MVKIHSNGRTAWSEKVGKLKKVKKITYKEFS
jgi:hypothetical protein